LAGIRLCVVDREFFFIFVSVFEVGLIVEVDSDLVIVGNLLDFGDRGFFSVEVA